MVVAIFGFMVKEIERREYGFVLAHIETRFGSAADFYFREVDGRWVLSEPTREQIGDLREIETDYFTFSVYPWTDDINDEVMALMENARARVETRLGQAPQQKALVEVIPIYGIDPGDPPNALAYYSYSQSETEPDTMVIFAPHSFLFGFYNASMGWEADLEDTLTHEYTHMAHRRLHGWSGRLADWMSEGLAEYVSESVRIYEVSDALRQDALIPILDESGAVYKQDLMHIYGLDRDVSLAYAEAHSLVEFIVAKHGGLDGFWKLAEALDDTSDFKKAVPQAFGISYEKFDKDWRAWLERKYGN